MQFTRRRFLKSTFGTTAACGLARLVAAKEHAPTDPIIDTHVYIGHWPHQYFPANDLADVVATLRQNRVSQAWVSSFDGLFHKDIGGVNQRLADTCSRTANGTLIPFGTINPMLPDWEEDVRRCHEAFHMPGIRLHPNYHGYTLDDPRFALLLESATARKLIVQLVAWMEDERHLLLNPHAAQVDLKPLAEKIAPLQGLKLVVANGDYTANDDATRALLTMKQLYFDFTRTQDAKSLLDKTSPDRVVLGSCSPLHGLEAVLSKMQTSQLKDGDRQAIASENAGKLIAQARKTSALESRDANTFLVSTP